MLCLQALVLHNIVVVVLLVLSYKTNIPCA